MTIRFVLLAFVLVTSSATAAPATATPLPLAVRDASPPVVADSRCSNLATSPDGTIHLTWSEPGVREGERALRHTSLARDSSQWSSPHTIVSSASLMENWADFASLTVGTDGALTAQWFLKPSDGNAHGYSGWFGRSTDGGATWTSPNPLGQEFVSLAPLSKGRMLAVWLEHVPSTKEARTAGAPSMQLSSCVLDTDGKVLERWTIDPNVCTCCQTTLAVLPGDRVLVAYRGHTKSELRDNLTALFSEGSWSRPQLLHADGWTIAGCPVNGPAADATGETVAVAWFTAADGFGRVQAKYSVDGGRTFGAAIRVDAGSPMGRVDLAMLGDGSAAIVWMEAKSEGQEAGIYARRVWPNGTLSAPGLLANSSQARASGFPRLAVRNDREVLVTFTETGQTGVSPRVRTLTFDPNDLPRGTDRKISQQPRRGFPPVMELCASPIATSEVLTRSREAAK